MINIAIQLDKFKKKDETFRLRILLSAKGKQAKIALPYSFPEGFWKNGKITREFKGRGKTQWNAIIQKHLNDMQEFLLEKEAHKYPYTPSEIKQMWLDANRSNDLYSVYLSDIEHLEKVGNSGNARARYETLSKLHEYLNRARHSEVIKTITSLKRKKKITTYLEAAKYLKIDLPKSKVNKFFLQNFDKYMIEQGLSPNSRGKHFRDLRAIFNKS